MFNHRWTPLSGIIFVVLMLTGAYFVTDVPAAERVHAGDRRLPRR